MKNLTALTNEELIRALKSLVGDERGGLVRILKHLSEFESRRLAVERGFPSLFDYCVRELRYAQGEAFRRIRAARAANKYAILYRMIERGALTLTTVALLEPHLRWENYRRLIRECAGRSTREVEAFVAGLNPGAAAPIERVRFVMIEPSAPSGAEDLFFPAINPGSPDIDSPPPGVEPPPPVEQASSADGQASSASAAPVVRRVHFAFTADEAFLRDIERAKELSRHRWPAGRLEDVFAGAIRALLDKIDPDKRNQKRRRRLAASAARSRKIPRSVKDEVWRRDEGRCAFVSPDGRACGARAGLEFDHVRPWAFGGTSENQDNVRLLCRAHNAMQAQRLFGAAVIDAAVRRRREPCAGG